MDGRLPLVMTGLARSWWLLVVRGVLAIVFGVLAWVWPGPTVLVLVLLFGAYALVDGVLALSAAISRGVRHERWGGLLIEGVLGIGAAVVAFVWPGITALALLVVIAAWAIATGIAEIAAAIRLRRHIDNEWSLGLAGVASVIFGVLLAVMPRVGILALTWLIGVYAIVFGIMLIVVGFRLRPFRGRESAAAPVRPAA